MAADERLPPEELLRSLDEIEENEVAANWSPELERRSRELASGEVAALEWNALKRELLLELDQRRSR